MFISLVAQADWHAFGRRLSALTPAVLKPYSRDHVRLDRVRLAGAVRRGAE